ncbi:hypothetical protein MRF4_16995 [Methylobacterium radiotolerans]|uniref:hypothetical protein n=1 Tax=Methylobacterium TaxID=407 RepID=UPI002F33467C
MDQSALPVRERPATEADALSALPTGVFIQRWQQITGEPPAVLLASRSAMIALLAESVANAPLMPEHGMSGRTDGADISPKNRDTRGTDAPDPG